MIKILFAISLNKIKSLNFPVALSVLMIFIVHFIKLILTPEIQGKEKKTEFTKNKNEIKELLKQNLSAYVL